MRFTLGESLLPSDAAQATALIGLTSSEAAEQLAAELTGIAFAVVVADKRLRSRSVV